MKTYDPTKVTPWSYLPLALLSSFVPFIHHHGLHQALDNTRYLWGLHPIEILWSRDLGDFSTWVAVLIGICFLLSWRVAWLRTIKAWKTVFTITLLFWVWYSICISLALMIQINIGIWK